MKKTVFLVLLSILLIGITTNDVWAQQDDSRLRRLVAKDGTNIVKATWDYTNFENYHISVQNENWEWYTPEEFEKVIIVALDPTKADDYRGWPPDSTFGQYENIATSITLNAERDRATLQQTLNDIKKGIKVSKPIDIFITKDGLYPVLNRITNFVGWAHWYVYSYTFTDKAGNKVDLGIYETRDGLFNALKFYCDKEARAGRMTKREANKLYGGLAHNVRNCDEVPLSDKLFNFRKLYNPYLWNPLN